MLRTFGLMLALLLANVCTLSAAEFTIDKQDDGLTIKLDGKLVTRYVTKSGAKPILFPIVGPSGKELTRGWPMRDALEFEAKDHPHHRSLWFTHGNVNGIDFWSESGKNGTIVHREFVKSAGGPTATIVSINDWLAPDGKKVCEDERTLRFGQTGETRWIDFDTTVKATEGPLTFGETKEGSFGVRVYETMKLTAKKGGRIVNSEGVTDKAAWGKAAAWVDYQGPVDGETVGIAILNHPKSFRFPTTWHVRDYGLFAANPFGGKDFSADVAKNYGHHDLAKGESITLRYRVILHQGDEKSAKIAEAFADYAK
ncbi:MAG TPA: PmoA family protein [Pirellulaceae bacterium]|nr:PmoA family protein [Pirellulaceae bacterium]